MQKKKANTCAARKRQQYLLFQNKNNIDVKIILIMYPVSARKKRDKRVNAKLDFCFSLLI